MPSLDAYTDARENAVVLHFTSCFLEGTRPWIKGDQHPQKAIFDQYKKASEWADMLPWEDKRGIKSKLVHLGVNLLPKCILAPIVGYIHGVYVPRKNKKKQMGN